MLGKLYCWWHGHKLKWITGYDGIDYEYWVCSRCHKQWALKP